MTKIDVFGSYVLSDVLRFAPSDRYQIYTELHEQSIPSLFSEPIYFDTQKIDWCDIAQRESKQLLINMNSVAIELLKNSKGEWLLLDLAEDRFDLCQIETERGMSKVTYSPVLQRLKNQFVKKDIMNEHRVQVVNFDKVSWNQLEKDYRKFAEIIEKKYTQEKIIVVEVREATSLVKNTLEIVKYPSSTRERTNKYLDSVNMLMKKLLPRAHFIKMPENTMMSENHMWGVFPLYYQESYYQYVLEAIDNITHNRMTYTVEQLYKEQNKKNLFYINAIKEKEYKNEKEVQIALGDVKEYRKEISALQAQLQSLQLEFAKMIIKNQDPNGNIEKSIIQLDKRLCSGCGACYNACPINAIIMTEDSDGFTIPNVNRDRCRNCGYCSSVCPRLNVRFRNSEKKFCLAVMAEDEVRKGSSSGGIFPILAEFVFKRNGYVCGAAWNENWEVEHKIIDNMNELHQLQGSKYVQSNMGKIYKEIQKLLNADKYVLFSGTPCQVDGLNHFLGKEYPKLITMDILCHGVPSQKTFNNYLESKYSGKKIKEILFRDKRKAGWGSYTTIEFEDGTSVNMSIQNCLWMIGFLNLYMHRDSCYHCLYTKTRRMGDFTAGDFWGIGKHYPRYNDGKGTSVLTLNSDKAVSIFDEIKGKFILKEWMHIENSIPDNSAWIKNKIEPKNRRIFLNYLKEEDYCLALEDTLYGGQIFDIGIVGWWYYYNYGSVLTYYALAKSLEKMGCSVLMIHHTNNGPYASRLANAFPENFIKKYLHISHFYNDDDIHLLNRRCKAFISGSDQLWNPYCENAAGKEFFLDFVDDEHLKLSYASSLGNAIDADASFKEKYAPLAQRFDGISVREEMGIQGCKNIYGVDAVKVCDPVFLCEREEFEKLARASKVSLHDKKYLLTFILDPDENKKRLIQEKSEELNMEYINLVDLTDAGEKAKKLGLPNVKPYASVEDFMNYFMNASFVITDSFHGTCFSIIYNKEFISIANYGRGEKRVEELLYWLGLEERIMRDSNMKVCDLKLSNINYSNVNNKIFEARIFAKEWLESYLYKIKR